MINLVLDYYIEIYQGEGLYYPLKARSEVDNTNRGLDKSPYHRKTEFNNCFIIYSKYILVDHACKMTESRCFIVCISCPFLYGC